MLKKILLGIVLNGFALYVVTKLVTDLQYTGGITFFIIGGAIIGILNTFVKPLMKLLSFPIVLLSAGLFMLIINVIIFWLTTKIVNGINFMDVKVVVNSVGTYFVAALIFGIVNWVLHILVHNK